MDHREWAKWWTTTGEEDREFRRNTEAADAVVAWYRSAAKVHEG